VCELKIGIQNSSTGDLALFLALVGRKAVPAGVVSSDEPRSTACVWVKKAVKAVIGSISVTYQSPGLVPGFFRCLKGKSA